MHPPAAPAFCRVTVLAPGRRVDVALPVDVPMAELNPLVLELLGEPARSPARPDPWRFAGATGAQLPPGATLDELGVLDGETLRLGPAAPPRPRRCSTTRSTRWPRSRRADGTAAEARRSRRWG